jgi:hypothetical protein
MVESGTDILFTNGLQTVQANELTVAVRLVFRNAPFPRQPLDPMLSIVCLDWPPLTSDGHTGFQAP